MIIGVNIRKRVKLNLILTSLELFIIYWECNHLFWFRFLKLLLIFYYQNSWQEIIILEKQFLIRPGDPKSNWKIKIRIFSSFILIFNITKLKKTNKYWFSKLSFKPLSPKKKETIYFSISLTIIPPRGSHVYMI